MIRRTILALLLAIAPALAQAQVRGTTRFDAVVSDGAVTAGSVVTPSLKLGAFTLTGVGTTAGTLAAGNDARIVGAAQTGSAASFSSVALSTPLPLSQGGCGATSALGCLSNLGLTSGASGSVLTSAGPGNAPTYQVVAGNVPVPHGQVRLSYTSSTTLTVQPFRGNQVWVNGANRTVPNGGVSCSNAGLTAATVYYVYLAYPSASLTCELSTTSHVADTTYGYEEKSGDPTRSLVGAVYTGAGSPGTFVDGPTARYTRSWFNDQIAIGNSAYTAQRTWGNTAAFASVNAEIQISILTWAGERAEARFAGSAYAGATSSLYVQIAVDGAAQSIGGVVITPPATNQYFTVAPSAFATPTEGLHTFDVYAKTSSATGVFPGDASNGFGQLLVRTAR